MNICIVEDHQLISQSLQNLLSSVHSDVYNVRVYPSAEAFFLEDFKEWAPDIIITDISLPGMDGLALIDKAKDKKINAKFIVLTAVVEMGVVKNALSKGVSGYLSKDLSQEELLEAIQEVGWGGNYVNKTLKDKIVEYQFNINRKEINFNLSRREKEVLQKLCDGYAQKEIAHELNLSINTVHHYIKNMMAKLKVNRTTDMVLLAIQHGICTPSKLNK